MAGTQGQPSQSMGIHTAMQGKLHFRMANVGHYGDPKANLIGIYIYNSRLINQFYYYQRFPSQFSIFISYSGISFTGTNTCL